MTRPIFCLQCHTMHPRDRACSVRGLKTVGGKSNSEGQTSRGAAASASKPATARSRKRADAHAASKMHSAQSARPPQDADVTDMAALKSKLTGMLPPSEAKKLAKVLAKFEKDQQANRDRVAAHKRGISVEEYRKQVARSTKP